MAEETKIGPTRARFIPQSGKDKNKEIVVHFNPMTLQYTVTNAMKPGKGSKTKQYVSQSTAKLKMDLLFDTTGTGEDVRTYTERIANFMMPNKRKTPPIVLFEWGTYTFQGMADSYSETLDFFAQNGVPLRASINLTLSRQDKVFEPSSKGAANTKGVDSFRAEPSETEEPVDVPISPDDDATRVATKAGDPRAARSIAEINNLPNMRMSGEDSLSVTESFPLGGPIAFSSGASLGGEAGLGLDAEAFASLSGSFGASASAGIAASAGAFGGLRSQASPTTSFHLDLDALVPQHEVASLATDSGASFQIGGKAIIESSSSLTADVSGKTTFDSRLRFDE